MSMIQPPEENPYRSPECSDRPSTETPEQIPSNEKLIREAVYLAIGESFIFGFFCALMLDDGTLARIWAIVLIGWWTAILLILLRYKYGIAHKATALDLFIIKYLCWPLFILVLIARGCLA
jgi:hypothetical protein